MAYTLSKLYRDWARELGLALIYTATGGGATTAVVGTFSTLSSPPEDDFCIDWQVVVDWDAAGAGALPEGQWSRISDYDSGTYTFTFATITAVAVGDRFMVVKDTITLEQFISYTQQALRNLGNIALKDATIPIVADTYRYNLPAAVRNISKIDWLDDDNIATPIPRLGWEVLPYTAGGTAVLDIKPFALPDDGDYLQIWYEGEHPDVSVYSSEISDTIPPELIKARVVYDSLSALPQSSKLWQEKYSKSVGDLNAAIMKYGGAPQKPKKQSKILTIGEA